MTAPLARRSFITGLRAGALLLMGFGIGVHVRDHYGWNRQTAQSVYWCGIVRESRRTYDLPREMPNSEAECSALEQALEPR